MGEILDVDMALNIDVPDEILVQRLTQRRSCPDCKAVYNLSNKPPKKEGICDKCGAQLYQRDDDKEETVKNRLDVYRKNTFPSSTTTRRKENSSPSKEMKVVSKISSRRSKVL